MTRQMTIAEFYNEANKMFAEKLNQISELEKSIDIIAEIEAINIYNELIKKVLK